MGSQFSLALQIRRDRQSTGASAAMVVNIVFILFYFIFNGGYEPLGVKD
jgi:hypothetical protein